MYVLRKLIEHKLRTSGITDDDCYICSLSSRTIVYKGQLTPAQVGGWVGGWAHRSREQAGAASKGHPGETHREPACGQWSSSQQPSESRSTAAEQKHCCRATTMV